MKKGTKSSTKTEKTKITVKYDCGIPNSLYIRGEGAETLSWDQGISLTNISPDEWVWETERPCTHIEFKILLNDNRYEIGENHIVKYGAIETINPCF